MIKSLHIEATNICTLKCPGCARTRFIKQWGRHWKNHSLDISELMQFIDIDISGMVIALCGNYGDPIYHPNALDFFRAFKERGSRLYITTNGSYRDPAWWKEVTDLLDSQDQITFSVDGLPENFDLYRINGDWDSIRKGMEICVSSQVRARWKYIPFQFNQDLIEQARNLSREIGIDEFFIQPSDRFDDDTRYLIPVDSLIGYRKPFQDEWKENSEIEIDPKCWSQDQHFISATGHYSPCCFIADHRFYYKTQFGRDPKRYDIRNQTLSELLAQPSLIKFYQDIPKNSPRVCQYSCPKSN